MIGTIRLWPVTAGAASGCLLLGPLAVAADVQGCGVGADLMRRALREAKRLGYRAVLLRDAPRAALSLGVSARRVRTYAFAISSGMAGLAGSALAVVRGH